MTKATNSCPMTAHVATHSQCREHREIQSSWEAISAEYGCLQLRYRAAVPDTALHDDASRKVRFRVRVAEMAIPHVFNRFSRPSPRTPCRRVKLKSGSVFDASYLSDFLKELASTRLANSKPAARHSSTPPVPNQSQLAWT